jgi:mono/diheme cytochrome c family protein
MLRIFFALLLLGFCGVLALAGLRGWHSSEPPLQIFPDMDHQPKYQPQHPSGFFADGRSSRKWVDGAVPMGYTLPGRYLQAAARNGSFGGSFSNQPDYANTGRMGEVYGDGLPLEVTDALLDRGEGRFNIHCAVCHGRTGIGNGIVQTVGSWATVANLLDDRIRSMPDGQIFNTITNGKNTMGAYGPNIAVDDRWAIIAYVRALQRSQRARFADLSPELQKQLAPAK